MNTLHVKKGDTVVVLSGKDKGKTGTILKAFPKRESVVVEGVNVVKRHRRATRSNQKGQIVERPMPLHVSNIKKSSATKAKKTPSRKK